MILLLRDLLLLALVAVPLLVASYLLALTVVAALARPAALPAAGRTRRFAIVVPAHNEELLIERLLENLALLDYPQDAFVVYVVADNCDDRTAALARGHGAHVFERDDRSQEGKGFALRYALEQIAAGGGGYDAYVVLDADSTASANLLTSLNDRLESGSSVIQVYYGVLNARESSLATLRYAALAAVHYLRPRARAALGLSCGLKGNGMCFAAPVLAKFRWEWYTLAEDVEFHLALVRAGQRVDFAPEAVVLADMPTGLRQAASQNHRWERGRLQLLRHHTAALLVEGARRRSLPQLDVVVEQLLPPLSVPVALAVSGLVLGWALGAELPRLLAALALGGLAVYLLAGLALVRAPWRAYLALSYAPVYVVWKVGIYARAVLSTRSARWIRTARAASPR